MQSKLTIPVTQVFSTRKPNNLITLNIITAEYSCIGNLWYNIVVTANLLKKIFSLISSRNISRYLSICWYPSVYSALVTGHTIISILLTHPPFHSAADPSINIVSMVLFLLFIINTSINPSINIVSIHHLPSLQHLQTDMLKLWCIHHAHTKCIATGFRPI